MGSMDDALGVWRRETELRRVTPRGRQIDEHAAAEIAALLGGRLRRRDLLIEHLHLIQDRFGQLSAAHLRALADEMRMAEAEVYEVATFYAHFDVVADDAAPPPPLTLRVCDSLTCAMHGAEELYEQLHDAYAAGREVRVLRAPCMGRCDAAPTVSVRRFPVDHATARSVQDAVDAGAREPAIPDYEALEAYRAQGGYETLIGLRAGARSPDAVEADLLTAGLRGLGGAGFPSGRKWAFVRAEPGPRYLAINADEGEPGTFKDRSYLEGTPHSVLEGVLIAAWAIAADTVFFYIRDEYPAAIEILRREIAALEAARLIPAGYIDLRRGAGAYICGEESAMIESIEGKRGLPRHRPPYVAQVGIFERPTLVHNVETLHWIAQIARDGPDAFAATRKNGRVGLRAYSVSGRVKTPGVKLLPAGSTILDVIDAAGGMAEGHVFKAYQPGGPSSGLLPAHIDDVPLDFDTLQPHDSFIGSAAVVVLSDQDSARDAALNMLRFFEHESCGQCTPCRIGCEKAVSLMNADRWDGDLLEELCQAMADASICGLGQAAPNPIRHILRHFRDEVA